MIFDFPGSAPNSAPACARLLAANAGQDDLAVLRGVADLLGGDLHGGELRGSAALHICTVALRLGPTVKVLAVIMSG